MYLKPLERFDRLDPSVFTPENTIMVDYSPASTYTMNRVMLFFSRSGRT